MKFEAIHTTGGIMELFSTTQKLLIRDRLEMLTPLCRMISGDFTMKVEVNEEEGWHWDFADNVVRCDAKDLLEKPIDYLRFVIQHEAGHRKVSRVIGVVPKHVWDFPGFSFLMNSIEDPRMNNYVADNIPKYRQEMIFAYDLDRDFEVEFKKKMKDKVGTVPRFVQAGFEYIKLWLAEIKGEELKIDKTLPDKVKEVVAQTLEMARRSWSIYPTRDEAERGLIYKDKTISGETVIKEYARQSYKINFEEIWPIFKTLIEEDIKDIADFIQNDLMGEIPDFKGSDDKDEQDENKQKKGRDPSKSDKANDNTKKGKKESREKERGKTDGNEKRRDENSKSKDGEDGETDNEESREKAKQVIREIEAKLSEHFQPQASQEVKEKKSVEGDKNQSSTLEASIFGTEDYMPGGTNEMIKDLGNANKRIGKEAESTQTSYEKVLEEVAPLITKLENQLREIFIQRKRNMFRSGFRSGSLVDIRREIASEAAGVEDLNTFMRRELPQEKDYVIEILVDLSGSMTDPEDKINQTYRAVVTLCEALKNIGIKLSVTGFNDRLHQYKDFEQIYDDTLRKKTETMLGEVLSYRGAWNDDGWALKQVADKIQKRPEKKKIIIVLSDGLPVPSYQHSGLEYELGKVIKDIQDGKDIHLIGLGIGRGTEHVKRYYKDHLADIGLEKFVEQLATKVREAIEKV